MSSEWKPGDVALVLAESNAQPRIGLKDTHGWAVTNGLGDKSHAKWVNEAYVSSIRPLVVIDPEDREQVERLTTEYVKTWLGPRETTSPESVDQMQAALREFANPTPPKPDEPLGLGAVVEDKRGSRWTRARTHDHENNWREEWGGRWSTYADLNVARVLSPGYTEDGA